LNQIPKKLTLSKASLLCECDVFFSHAAWLLCRGRAFKTGGGTFSISELRVARCGMAASHTIISSDVVEPEAVGRAQLYYSDIEFASQLCIEFAAAESSNSELSTW
jgi:hypothetical protein